ncbi:MAG: hypothetical protein ACKON9_30350, partial [Planctomycetaceae bacterium]
MLATQLSSFLQSPGAILVMSSLRRSPPAPSVISPRFLPLRLVTCGLLGLLSCLLPLPAAAQTADTAAPAQTQPQYIRIRKNDRKLAVALETSVAHFTDSQKYPDA